MRATTSQNVAFITTACLCVALVAVSCLPRPPGESGDITITLYGFSIMKESLEKAIFPGFTARSKQLHGQEVRFQSSFAGSETVTNQILQGAPADVAIVSIERDAQRLKNGGFSTSDWRSLPSGGIVNKTPFIIIVRRGNPKGILPLASIFIFGTSKRVHLRREIRALLRKVNVPSIFITHDQEEALELGDRVAVLNRGHIEQLGTPHEIYNHPATEYVATFLGAANILEATVKNGALEIGSAHLPAALDHQTFRNGQCVKIVFRPEDVVLSKGELTRSSALKISAARIEEISFVGAYERLRLRLDRGADECRTDEDAYYLTTDTPESQSTKAIIATRPKPEAAATKLQIGDRVTVAITSFTVLPTAN